MISAINKYEEIVTNISYYIDISGYKNNFLSEQLGIGRVSFQRKKANSSFTFEQIRKLSKFIFAQEYVEKTELLERVIQQSMQEANEKNFIENSQVKRSTNA
ncbi:MAG: hypothetical protein JKY53_05940 [Flavobacteriales bacterium]|nr:hypothetical protein [Flavobacteriales bacterium]